MVHGEEPWVVADKKPLNFHNILDVYPQFLSNINLLAAGTREIDFNNMFQDWRDTSNLVSTSYLCNQCLAETHFFNNTVIQCLRNQNNTQQLFHNGNKAGTMLFYSRSLFKHTTVQTHE